VSLSLSLLVDRVLYRSTGFMARIASRGPLKPRLHQLPSAILINFRGQSQNLRRHTKFGQNRMIGGRDIAIKPKSNTAAAAMLNLLPVYNLTHFQD